MDSCLCDRPELSLEDFFYYDYVGAPWNINDHKSLINPKQKIFVGNGGFSLRKKKTMIQVCNLIHQKFPDLLKYNEDIVISSLLTSKYFFWAKLPTWKLASKFAVECVFIPGTIGTHKPWKHLNSKQFNQLIEQCSELIRLFKGRFFKFKGKLKKYKMDSRTDIRFKYDIVNYLGKKYNYSNFLEISSTITGHAYDKIDKNIFTAKEILFYLPDSTYDYGQTSIRSDLKINPINYEEGLNKLKDRKFDIVFVDPCHTFEQSQKDIQNALNLVSDNGIVVVHDCCPKDFYSIGPYKPGEWSGQTYEAFIDFNINNPYIETCVVDTDYGCGIIFKNKIRKIPYQLPPNLKFEDSTQWAYFITHLKELINLISVEEFKQIF